MRKKFIYIGVILIIVAFGLLILASSLLSSTVGSLFTEKNLTVSSMSFAYAQVPFANQSAILAMVSDSPVNFYLFNSTGFSRWTSIVYTGNSLSGYRSAVSLEGAGMLYGYSGAKSATVPYAQAIDNVSPFYETNSLLSGNVAGTYYAVVDNTNGSASSSGIVKATILYQSRTASLTSVQTASAAGILGSVTGFFVLLIAGIILIIYGLFKKAPAQPSGMQTQAAQEPKQRGDMTEEQIDQLYKNIKKKSQGKSKRSR